MLTGKRSWGRKETLAVIDTRIDSSHGPSAQSPVRGDIYHGDQRSPSPGRLLLWLTCCSSSPQFLHWSDLINICVCNNEIAAFYSGIVTFLRFDHQSKPGLYWEEAFRRQMCITINDAPQECYWLHDQLSHAAVPYYTTGGRQLTPWSHISAESGANVSWSFKLERWINVRNTEQKWPVYCGYMCVYSAHTDTL